MSEFNDTIDNGEIAVTEERPQFLTVLCVLSWIMGGLSVIGGLALLFMRSFMDEVLDQMSAEEAEQMTVFMENYNLITYSTLVLYILSIFAVIMMYRLSKVGFYIYVVTHIALSFYQYLYTPFVVDGSFIFSMVILFGFIGMYAANLKAMK